MEKPLLYLILACLTILAGCSSGSQSAVQPQCLNHVGSYFVTTYRDNEKLSGLVRSVRTERQNPEWIIDVSYDREGRRITSAELGDDRVPLLSHSFEYGRNGFLERETTFLGSAEEQVRLGETTYTYNDDGTAREIKYVHINQEDKSEIQLTGVFTNDAAGNYFLFDRGAGTESRLRLGILRDEQCRISAVYEFGRFGDIGLWSTKTVFTYDERGNPILVGRYAPFGFAREELKYEYEFDEKANWVKKSEFSFRENEGVSGWQLIGHESRTIEYFE